MLTYLTVPTGIPYQQNLKFEVQKSQSQLPIGIKLPPQQTIYCMNYMMTSFECLPPRYRYTVVIACVLATYRNTK